MKFNEVNCSVCNSSNYSKQYDIKSKVPFTVVKCQNCGMLYMNPMVSDPGELYSEEYYQGTSEEFSFTDPLKDIEATSLLYKERLERIQKITSLSKGSLLDVGCTYGVFLHSVRDSGWELNGCDLSPFAVKMAKEKLGLDIRLGRAADAGFEENHFDVITLFEVIEHMDRPKDEMAELHKLIKKDGWLVVQTGNLGSLTARIRGASNPYFQLGHLNYFSKKTLKKLLEESGFKVVKIETRMEKIEPAKIKLGKAKLKDYWRLFYYNLFEKLNLSGGMTFYAQKT